MILNQPFSRVTYSPQYLDVRLGLLLPDFLGLSWEQAALRVGYVINWSLPGHNGCHFANDIFRRTFVNE